MNEAKWYLKTKDEVLGPVVKDVLVEWSKIGCVQRDHEVSEDNVTWTPVEKIAFLKEVLDGTPAVVTADVSQGSAAEPVPVAEEPVEVNAPESPVRELERQLGVERRCVSELRNLVEDVSRRESRQQLELESALADSGSRLAALAGELEKSKKDHQAAAERASSLAADLEKQTVRAAGLEASLDDSEARVRMLTSRLEEGEVERRAKSEQVASLTAEREQMTVRIGRLESALVDAEDLRRSLEKKLADAEEVHRIDADKRAALEAEIAGLSADKSRLEASLKTSEEQGRSLEKRLVDAGEAQRNEVEKTIALKADIDRLSADISRLSTEKTGLETSLKEAESRLQNERQELEQEKVRHRECAERGDALARSLEQSEKKIAGLEDDLKRLPMAIDEIEQNKSLSLSALKSDAEEIGNRIEYERVEFENSRKAFVNRIMAMHERRHVMLRRAGVREESLPGRPVVDVAEGPRVAQLQKEMDEMRRQYERRLREATEKVVEKAERPYPVHESHGDVTVGDAVATPVATERSELVLPVAEEDTSTPIVRKDLSSAKFPRWMQLKR